MARTAIELSRDLGTTVHLCGSIQQAVALVPSALFSQAHVLVIDDIPWRASLDVIRTGLDAQHRKHKAPWATHAPAANVAAELEALVAEVQTLFGQLYPTSTAVWFKSVFRPMITGPEPLHFDTYEEDDGPRVAAFLNVSSVPRIYNVGATLYQLVERDHRFIRALWDGVPEHDNFSLYLRKRGSKGLPPLDPSAPRHRVEFAPGAIWFFNAKTVSHEVIYGEGALSCHWLVPGMAELQSAIIQQ